MFTVKIKEKTIDLVHEVLSRLHEVSPWVVLYTPMGALAAIKTSKGEEASRELLASVLKFCEANGMPTKGKEHHG